MGKGLAIIEDLEGVEDAEGAERAEGEAPGTHFTPNCERW